MLDIVAIDGSPQADAHSVAQELAQRLGRPLIQIDNRPLTTTDDDETADDPNVANLRARGEDTPCVAEGPGALDAVFHDARWKVYLEAEGGLPDPGADPALRSIPPDALLIDTTGIGQARIVEIVAALVQTEIEPDS